MLAMIRSRDSGTSRVRRTPCLERFADAARVLKQSDALEDEAVDARTIC